MCAWTMAGAAGLTASSYFGGSFWDQGLAIAVDSGDEIVISGWTEVSSTMPSTPGADRRLRAGNDGFLARFSPDLKQLYYGGFVGGTDYDGVWHLHATGAGDVTVAGITFSVDLPVTANAAQSQNGGGDETWVGQFALIPANTTRYGGPSPGVAGHPTIHAVADATLNNPNFGLACTRAPANTLGAIVFAFGSAPGTPLQGIDLWIDPNQIVATSFLFSDANGEIVWPLPTPGFSFTLFSQFFWLESSNPLQLSASDALQIN
ncbi:MAG: hypothetical protein NXI31_20360 [bacterium]|nr:hypothetical protein [bacterium]